MKGAARAYPEQHEEPMSNLLLHLSHCAASALARQTAFADFLGERGWGVDLGAGAVTFGPDLRFPIQLLGTESELDRTWLWAWANEQSIPPGLLRAAEWLREYGLHNQIQELTQANLLLDHADGHLLAMLSAGLTGRCYYRGPYDGGALFFLVEGVPPAVLAPVSLERTVTVMTQVLQMYDLDHRTLVENFLSQQGFAVMRTATTISARHPSGSGLQVGLDQLGRIERIQADVHRG
jgi:hypothetical protein